MRVVDAPGKQGQTKVHDELGHELGEGRTGTKDGEPSLDVAFADGATGEAVLSPDAQALKWKDGEVWTRKPQRDAGLAGTWYDENNDRKTIDPPDSAGAVRARDEDGSEIGQGTFSGKPGAADGLEMAFAEGGQRAAKATPDGEQLRWDDGKVWRRAPPQDAVAGVWYDDANNRRKVELNPYAAEAASVQSELTNEVDELLRRLGKAPASPQGHAAHQLYELQPTLEMEVSDTPTEGKGLRVLDVGPELGSGADGERGPAAAAGISRGDYIAAVDGKPVKSKRELEDQVSGLTAGDRVPIKVIDGQTGSPRTVEAVVGAVGVDGATVQALREASGAASKDEAV